MSPRASDFQTLWSSPEQAGFLRKRSHGQLSGWQERFFVLKASSRRRRCHPPGPPPAARPASRHAPTRAQGSSLFYFKSRQHVKRLQGVINLESAKVETELPVTAGGGARKPEDHCISVTLHVSSAYSAKHPFYVLQAPTAQVQEAWANALWQAAVPRGSLLAHLQRGGLLCDVVAEFAQQLQLCFPTADAAVLSSSGRARMSGLGNVGQLAGALRRHRVSLPAGQDMAQPLPTVPAPAGAEAPTILARTESGTVVPATVAPAAAAPAAAAPVGVKAPPPGRVSISASSAAAGPKGGQWHGNPLAEDSKDGATKPGKPGASPAAVSAASSKEALDPAAAAPKAVLARS
jgi:hypothetical protein